MNKNSKIYISGHRGMVGKTMLKFLKNKGYKNIVTKTSRELDLRDQKSVDNFFQKGKPEYVLHFAAKVGGIMANINHPVEFLQDNLYISANVISSAFKYGVKKLINLGSSCIYPKDCPQPMEEEYLLTGSLESTNEGYALSKIIALKLCEYYNKSKGTNFISLMPCNLYGINERFDSKYSHVISALIMKFYKAKVKNSKSVTLWGTGMARREFLYVEDFCRIALNLMLNCNAKDLNNKFINIGSGTDISIKELANLVAKIVGYKGKITWDNTKPDGMPKKLLSIENIKRYDFPHLITLEKGIKLTYDYYLKTLK